MSAVPAKAHIDRRLYVGVTGRYWCGWLVLSARAARRSRSSKRFIPRQNSVVRGLQFQVYLSDETAGSQAFAIARTQEFLRQPSAVSGEV